MNYLDNDFFEEFKKLDNLCRTKYGRTTDNKLGVSSYIDDMEKNAMSGKCMVPGWEQAYRTLKKCRHIRNQLAHGRDPDPGGLCTPEDIDFVRSFHESILNQTDPLALLAKQMNSVKRNSHQHTSYQIDSYEEFEDDPFDKKLSFLTFVLFACIGIVVLLIFGIFFTMLSSDSLLGVF